MQTKQTDLVVSQEIKPAIDHCICPPRLSRTFQFLLSLRLKMLTSFLIILIFVDYFRN